eukprot:TRINITY_DN5379_c0_g1_i1.p1 TRINITY_DN5379_c0_g1~~TRINITY_DN5379_c0_g1_i1.p1  ORF type:complete len:528 (-),score=161.90 TRINITY_DN5379_c0_g1_i1:190-1740(-)
MGQKIPTIAQEKFSQIELEQLEKHFVTLAQQSGSNEFIFEKPFLKYFLKETPDLNKKLFTAFDFDLDGKLGRPDFFQSMAICTRTSLHSRLAFVYRMFDPQNVKKIDAAILKTYFEPVSNEPVVEYVKAIWDFDKRHPKEIGAKRDEVLAILKKHDDVWWLVQNANGEAGYIAANYVQVIPQPPPPKSALDSITDSAGKVEIQKFLEWAPKAPEVVKLADKLMKFDIRPPPAFELSTPTNFRHTTHLGLNPKTGGFDINQLPDEWKTLFQKANLSKEDVENPETAQFILSIVQEEKEKQRIKKKIESSPFPPVPTDLPPPLPSNVQYSQQPEQPTEPKQPEPAQPAEPVQTTEPVQPLPPPQLPPKTQEPEEPKVVAPPIPPHTSEKEPQPQQPKATPVKAPPPPPAPSTPAPPAPPAPVQPSTPATSRPLPQPKASAPPPLPAEQPSVTNWLDDIKKGKTLRKVDPKDVVINDLSSNEQNDLANILKKALDSRRTDIAKGREESNDDDNNAEWED